MKVGIDLTITRVNQAGTGVYVSSLVNALDQEYQKSLYYFFSSRHYRDMSRKKTVFSRFYTLYRDIIWMHGLLPLLVRRAKIDILHMPANVMPVFAGRPTVLTILDTTVLEQPRNFPFWHRNYSRFFMPLSAQKASRILTISEQSKSDIVKKLSVSPEKVIVTPLAASKRFRLLPQVDVIDVREKYNLSSYILTVGTLEPRKNIIRLLQAFELVRRAGYAIELVHVGPHGWLFDDIAIEIRRLQLDSVVHFLGRVPLGDLVKLYNGAKIFAYPSLYEGFGLPPLEAMACGCPVVTSNISSLPEVVGQAAMTVDPYDVQSIARAIYDILESPEKASMLQHEGLLRAKLFSWERCASETMSVYRDVFSET